jgi:hypothetical protein
MFIDGEESNDRSIATAMELSLPCIIDTKHGIGLPAIREYI